MSLGARSCVSDAPYLSSLRSARAASLAAVLERETKSARERMYS